MHIPPQLPLPLDLVPFHVREAAYLGVEPARLRRNDLSAPFRGIRTANPLVSVEDHCSAYLPLLGPQRWFSHSTAARLWGMWLPTRVEAPLPLHVSAAWPSREPRSRNVIGHRIAAGSVVVTMARGMPLLSPADCWCSLSAALTIDELIIAGESVVTRKLPLGTLEQLVAAAERYGSRRGAERLRRAQRELRGNADSAREVVLRLVLERAGLPVPIVNLSIRDAVGEMFGDLAFPEWKVLAEYDGRHHLRPDQAAKDIIRAERLTRLGWTVVRVMGEHLAHPDTVVTRVARALHDNGWRPPRSRLHLLQ